MLTLLLFMEARLLKVQIVITELFDTRPQILTSIISVSGRAYIVVIIIFIRLVLMDKIIIPYLIMQSEQGQTGPILDYAY